MLNSHQNRKINQVSLWATKERRLILGAMVLTIFVFASMLLTTAMVKAHFNQSDWSGDKLIGEGFGSVGDWKCTNSLEAFEEAYGRGIRTFEVYFSTTSDGKLVLRRSWKSLDQMQEGVDKEHIPTREEFLALPIYGELTPLSLLDLYAIMEKYPDIWIVTRTGSKKLSKVKKEFEELYREAEEYGNTELLNRMIVTLYSEEMLETVKEVYAFSHYLLYLIGSWDGKDLELFRTYCEWSGENQIDGIVLDSSIYSAESLGIAAEYEIDLYLYSIETAGVVQLHLDNSVRGCYVGDVEEKKVFSSVQDGPFRWFSYRVWEE